MVSTVVTPAKQSLVLQVIFVLHCPAAVGGKPFSTPLVLTKFLTWAQFLNEGIRLWVLWKLQDFQNIFYAFLLWCCYNRILFLKVEWKCNLWTTLLFLLFEGFHCSSLFMCCKLYYRGINLTSLVLSCSSSEILRKQKKTCFSLFGILYLKGIFKGTKICVISFFVFWINGFCPFIHWHPEYSKDFM